MKATDLHPDKEPNQVWNVGNRIKFPLKNKKSDLRFFSPLIIGISCFSDFVRKFSSINLYNNVFVGSVSKANPGLAVEALAGLASREELTSVVLRRSADTGPVKQVAQWTHPLLLRTKGRRHPVTCTVPPTYTSVNQGDAYILVTSNQVILPKIEFTLIKLSRRNNYYCISERMAVFGLFKCESWVKLYLTNYNNKFIIFQLNNKKISWKYY